MTMIKKIKVLLFPRATLFCTECLSEIQEATGLHFTFPRALSPHFQDTLFHSLLPEPRGPHCSHLLTHYTASLSPYSIYSFHSSQRNLWKTQIRSCYLLKSLLCLLQHIECCYSPVLRHPSLFLLDSGSPELNAVMVTMSFYHTSKNAITFICQITVL